MHLSTLRLFCDVVRLRSFSRGAAANGVSQSAASQAIHQIEADLDVVLVDRSRRPLAPTSEGRAFYETCRGLLDGFDKARDALRASRERVEGTVRVAAMYSVGLHDMSRHMQPFMASQPARPGPARVPASPQGGRGGAERRGRSRYSLVSGGDPRVAGAAAARTVSWTPGCRRTRKERSGNW